MKNNPVYQVLVVTNPTLLAAGNKPENLAIGQLGIFNAETGLSITAEASFTAAKRLQFAVGLPNATNTALGDVKFSAGQYVDKALIQTIGTQEYVAPVSQSIALDLSSLVVSTTADEDYVFRFSFRSGRTMTTNDIISPSKAFVVTVPAGSSIATLCDLVVAEVAKDEEAIVTATDNTTGVTFTFAAEPKENTLNGLNPRYDFLRQYKVDYGFGGAFEGKVYTVTVTDPVFEQGSGYDLVQEEYFAGGWEQGLYRDSALNGLFQHKDFKFFANPSTNYWTARLKYGLKSTSGGSLDYESYLETLIAVPQTADNLTFINSLVTIFSTYLGQSAYVAEVTTTTTTVPVTTTTTTVGG